MKLAEGFFLRVIGDKGILIPVGKRVRDFDGMMSLNETGKFLCECMKNETEVDQLVSLFTERFDVDSETARKDILSCLGDLRNAGVIV